MNADDQKTLTGKKILVVDDEKFVRELIRIKLSYLGATIIEAGNGEEGLEKAVETSPDLVLLDVMMPRMNGFEACEKLKANAKTSGIPVILLTARGEKENREKGLAAGASEYLFKPFSPKKLGDTVSEILNITKP
ncbi:MAG TPA: response regulator [Nitrospiria bacterium]